MLRFVMSTGILCWRSKALRCRGFRIARRLTITVHAAGDGHDHHCWFHSLLTPAHQISIQFRRNDVTAQKETYYITISKETFHITSIQEKEKPQAQKCHPQVPFASAEQSSHRPHSPRDNHLAGLPHVCRARPGAKPAYSPPRCDQCPPCTDPGPWWWES